MTEMVLYQLMKLKKDYPVLVIKVMRKLKKLSWGIVINF